MSIQMSIAAGDFVSVSTSKALCWRLMLCIFTLSLLFGVLCAAGQSSARRGDDAGNKALLKPAERGGKWGYVDEDGNFVIAAQFNSANPFSEGLAAVRLNERFGYIGKDGRFVVPPKYFRAGPFKEGFAWVVTRKPWTPLGTGEYGFALFGQVTYIDHSGREIIRPFSAEQVSNFSEGMAAVRPGKIYGGCSQKLGYLDTKGDWAIQPRFDDGHDFSEGLAAVNLGGKCHLGGKWGYIDRDGRMEIPFKYDFAGQFSGGHACVEEAHQWKLLNESATETPLTKDECLRR